MSFTTTSYGEKARAKFIKSRWNTSVNRGRLLEAFSLAEKHGFMKAFLEDLFQESEIEQLGRRMEALHMLFADTPYRQITVSTGLSSTIIARISKKTANKEGGYRQAMESLYPHGYKYIE